MKSLPKLNHGIALGLIAACTFLAYAGSFRGAFQFDDMYYIVNNAALRDITDLSAIWHAIHTPIRFLTFYTFALNYHLHEYDVFGYHVVNFGIHLGNTLLVYRLVWLVFRTPRVRRTSLVKEAGSIALVAALLFGTHPLLTQAVTYISQRFASLAAFFYILSICFYILGRLRGGGKRVLFFVMCFLSMMAGMFSKQTTITIPVMILATEFLLFDRAHKNAYRYAFLFFPLVLLIPMLYQFKAGFMASTVVSGNSAGELIYWKSYALTQTRVILTYLKLFIIPLGQRLDYLFPASHSLWDWKVLSSLGVLGSLLFLGFRARLKQTVLSFGIFWLFITLLVESSFIIIKHVIFEHRIYLSAVGLVIMASFLLHYVMRVRCRRVIACICIVGTLMFLTFERNKVWQTDFTLWEDNLKKEPEKARPYTSLGIAHIRKKNFDEAIALLNRAIELDPTQLKSFHNRGLAYQEKGFYQLALEDYSRALELKGHKGIIYSNRGSLYRILGRPEESLNDFNASIKINPGYAQVYVNRGVHFGERQMHEIALQDFNTALALYPNLPEALNNRGVVYQKMKRFPESEMDFNQALALKPKYVEALYNRGNTYKETKRFSAALADYQQALKINPRYAEVYNNQGIVFGVMNRMDLAQASFDRAVELQPDFAEAYYNRSLVYIRQRKFTQALAETRKAQNLGKKIKSEYLKSLEEAATSAESISAE